MTISRKKRRQLRQDGVIDKKNKLNESKFTLRDITREYNLTDKQQQVIQAYDEGKNLILHGLAGTGKTWLACYLGIDDVVSGGNYNKVILFRSVVPTRDMGFLPGSVKQKAQIYEEPYRAVYNELFGRGDAYEILKTKNLVEFSTTSFLRGLTFDHSIIIVDEVNNMSFHELDSLITRSGKNTKIIFCGDFRQSDLTNSVEREGLKRFFNVLNNINGFEYFEFEENDIVRSKLVKSYIIAKHGLGYV
jgi:phosphate starvation-inducible protein PhoH|tara:strand:- start:7110 stop:7850 length:741 start_codon:yes stop_codon:yes gene_type:complete